MLRMNDVFWRLRVRGQWGRGYVVDWGKPVTVHTVGAHDVAVGVGVFVSVVTGRRHLLLGFDWRHWRMHGSSSHADRYGAVGATVGRGARGAAIIVSALLVLLAFLSAAVLEPNLDLAFRKVQGLGQLCFATDCDITTVVELFFKF